MNGYCKGKLDFITLWNEAHYKPAFTGTYKTHHCILALACSQIFFYKIWSVKVTVKAKQSGEIGPHSQSLSPISK